MVWRYLLEVTKPSTRVRFPDLSIPRSLTLEKITLTLTLTLTLTKIQVGEQLGEVEQYFLAVKVPCFMVCDRAHTRWIS